VEKEVELFTWEKLDYVERIKELFGIHQAAKTAVS